MLSAHHVPGAGSRSSGLGKARISIPVLLVKKSGFRGVKKFVKHHAAKQVTEPDLHSQNAGCYPISRRSLITIIILTSHLGDPVQPILCLLTANAKRSMPSWLAVDKFPGPDIRAGEDRSRAQIPHPPRPPGNFQGLRCSPFPSLQ